MTKEKKSLTWLLVFCVLAVVGIAAFYVIAPRLKPYTNLRIGDGIFNARLALTDADKLKGLSGTATLDTGQALIFVYDYEDTWAIWMKDMNYPIDIIWLNNDKKIVHIVTNAPPESYPSQSFTPNKEARYVIELPAGTIDARSIKINTQAVFDETKRGDF